jgi:hypothetical protein
MRIAPEIGNVSLVLLGQFNPPIIRPDWLARNDIIPQRSADGAEIKVIHPEITVFSMEWLSVKVQVHRFVAEITEAPYIRLSDLVVRTFREFLHHTPIWAVGINRTVHFNVKDEETRTRIGMTLAPPRAWGKWGDELVKEIENPKDKIHGGMLSLTMQQRILNDRLKGSINARVEPSTKLGANTSGIFIEVNDHYEVEDRDKATDATETMDIVQKNFEKSIARSEWIIDQVMELA